MKKETGRSASLPPVRIEKLVQGGAGLGFGDGPVFIPLTAPGDLVVPAEVRKARGVYFAEAGEVLDRSAGRTDPPCPWFGQCGGCQWMHMDYSVQLNWKEIVAEETLRRLGKLEGIKFEAVHGSPVELGYRHRARLHIEDGRTGFFRRRSRTVVDWDRCLLLPDPMNFAIPALRPVISRGMLPPQLHSFEAAASPVDGAMTLKWDMGEGSVPGHDLERAMEGVEKALSGAGLRTAGQVFLDAAGKRSAERGSALKLQIGGREICASPGTFFQVNPWVNEILVEKVLDRLKGSGVEKLLDLFCGNGNFSIPALREGMDIDGVDSNPAGIRDAASAAGGHGRFHAQDVERFLDDSKGRWDAVLVDPPRTGLPRGLVRKLLSRKIAILVYVSCESATLARDLALLVAGGYAIVNAELFDMFPQTPHAEVMVVLERN